VTPIYGFLEGDTVGLLILADERETVADLARKLQEAAQVRVRRKASFQVLYNSIVLDRRLTLKQAGIRALDRIDVIEERL